MLTPTKSRSHRSPGRTVFILLLVLAVVATVAGLGYLLVRPDRHARPGAVASGSSSSPPSPQQTTPTPAPSSATTPSPSQLPAGVVPFVALPVGTPPTPGVGEARYPWHQLKASLQGPTTVSAGSTVSYTVVLRNPTSADVPLAPCPSYDIVIGLRTASYGLNCAAAPTSTVAAGGSMRFEVRVYVPTSIGAGRSTVTWTLGWQADRGSPHAQLRVEVQ